LGRTPKSGGGGFWKGSDKNKSAGKGKHISKGGGRGKNQPRENSLPLKGKVPKWGEIWGRGGEKGFSQLRKKNHKKGPP